jgi:hypothetical protein
MVLSRREDSMADSVVVSTEEVAGSTAAVVADAKAQSSSQMV